ncbi:MAG: GNAT family N-acetyltransferase [Dysgonomonas sp.]
MDFTLREWCASDLASLVKYANNYNIAKFLTDQFPHPYTHEDGEKYLSVVLQDKPSKVLAIDIQGEAVGSIGIFPETDIHAKNAEMGYWLAEEYWGKGIMGRAIQQIVNYGFSNFDLTRIYARPFGTNSQSQRVLEKAGFILEARLKNTVFKNGEFIDEVIYAIRKG